MIFWRALQPDPEQRLCGCITAPRIPPASPQILYEETLFQESSKGSPLVGELTARGVVPGIKVDIGTVPLPGSPSEFYTQGLDNLRQRCDK